MAKSASTWKYAPLGWLLHGLAWLPFWVLYRLSDVVYFILYYLVRYRRRVVIDNITTSFPELSAKEVKRVARKFYLNLTDLFFEAIKLPHASDAQMRRRMVYENAELVDDLMDRGRSMVCYSSHCINWEWAPAITLWTRHKPSDEVVFSQVYRPLANKWFDAYFLRLRRRFGSVSYPKQTVFRDIILQKRKGQIGICGFMSDQKPSHGDPGHVMMFLNHPTAMITGAEMIARKLDQSVVYMDMYKLKRGHYKTVMRLIAEDPNALPEMAITERYAHMLEQSIRRNPSIWLWSHKRWKIHVNLPPITAKQ